VLPARPPGLRQVYLEKGAEPSPHLGERIERLGRPSPRGPATAAAGGQRDDRHPTLAQRGPPVLLRVPVQSPHRNQIIRADVGDGGVRRQAILREPDATALEIGANALVVLGIEPAPFEQRIERVLDHAVLRRRQ